MAGNASNWVKATAGPRKGQRVYVPGYGGNLRRMTQPGAYLGAYTSASASISAYRALIQNNVNSGATGNFPPAGVAKRGGAIAPIAERGGTATQRGQPMDMQVASGLIRAAESASGDQVRTKEDGNVALTAIYTAQGFHAKPDVVTSRQLDSYVSAGETEVFRGTYGGPGNPDIWNETFRSSDRHYAGSGIYGNGTYVGSLREAQGYTGGSNSGTILRMTIKADAKIGDYNVLNTQRIDEGRIAIARGDSTEAYVDVGAYAAAKGYDGYVVPGSRGASLTDYHVILNRAAVRVQDTSLSGSIF